MDSENWSPEEYLPTVEALAQAGRDGDRERFRAALDELTSIREQSLFREIGKLTRQLHDALAGLQFDSRLAEAASSEFPEARNRLDQVIAMTEQSAHQTMDLVEKAMPLVEGLLDRNRAVAAPWDAFRRKKLSAEDFRELVADVTEHLRRIEEDAGQVRTQLSEVLIAQGFQDLSGQEIRKVMRIVEEIEQTLINMIRLPDHEERPGEPSPGESDRAAGDKRVGQAEADDILSSLGF